MSRDCTLQPVAVVEAKTERIVSRGGASSNCTVWPPRELPPTLEGTHLRVTRQSNDDVVVVSAAGKEIQRVALPRTVARSSLYDVAHLRDERYLAVCGLEGV